MCTCMNVYVGAQISAQILIFLEWLDTTEDKGNRTCVYEIYKRLCMVEREGVELSVACTLDCGIQTWP